MSGDDLTVAVLREIRDEVRQTRTDLSQRIDAVRTDLGSRIDQTNVRLDHLEAETRQMAEGLKELAAQQLMLGRYIKNIVDRHEQSLGEIRERLTKLEGRGGEGR